MSPRAHGRLATCAGVLGVVALGASAVLLWQRPAAGTDAYLSDVETVRVAVTGVPDGSARDAEAPRPAPPGVETDRVRGPEHHAPAAVAAPVEEAAVEDAPVTGPAHTSDDEPAVGSEDEQAGG